MEKTMENLLPIILLFIIAGMFLVWNIWAKERIVKSGLQRTVCLFMLLCFVSVFLIITLGGRESIYPRRAWLIPLYSYYKYVSGWQTFLFVQDIQNILMFIPLGFFGSILLERPDEKKRRIIIMGCGVFLSLFVEVMQYSFAIGVFEVDDILHNTLGTILGCLLFEMICSVRVAKKQNVWYSLEFSNRTKFIKNAKFIGTIVGIFAFITIVAYANHLYHVYVLWK